jgi:hypothetical protein
MLGWLNLIITKELSFLIVEDETFCSFAKKALI